MLHRMAGQCGVVCLQIEFKVFEKAVFPQEVQTGRRVGIVLMFGGFLGFRLDIEGSLEADLLFVIDGHVQELRKVLNFPFHVGIPEA